MRELQNIPGVTFDEEDLLTLYAEDWNQLVAAVVALQQSGGGGTPAIFKTYLTADSTVNDSTAWTQKDVFNTTPVINVGDFTVTAANITVPENGIYAVSVNALYQSAGPRPSTLVRLAINGVGGAEEGRTGYIRNTSGHQESSAGFTTLYELEADDLLTIQFKREANPSTVNLESGSYITLQKVGESV